MTNLMQASDQWANRPDDERFWTIDEMHTKTHQSFLNSQEFSATLDNAQFHSQVGGRAIGLTLGDEQPCDGPLEMSHFAFGQMCRTFGAPTEYLRSLPAHTAVQCLDYGMNEWRNDRGPDNATRQFLLHGAGNRPMIQAATSDRYSRVWNHEIVSRLGGLHASGWRVPSARPASFTANTRIATQDDVIDYGHESALTVKVGDTIGPAGLYASDHDMFAFLIHPEIAISDGESPHGLRRGTMIRQSEVGDCAIWKLDFLFNTVCGNHIVWGAQDVTETRVRHTGAGVSDRWEAMVQSIDTYAQESAHEQEQKIRDAKTFTLGSNREEIMDFLFGKRLLGKRDAGAAFDIAEEFEAVHGNPRSAWGVVQGITRLSQMSKFADKRSRLDVAAGKILSEVLCLN